MTTHHEPVWTPDRDFARGHGRVQLLDAYGRIDREVPFTNAVMDVELTHAKWRTRRAFSEAGVNDINNQLGVWPNWGNDPEPTNWMERDVDSHYASPGDRLANFCVSSDARAVVGTQTGILGDIPAWCSRYEIYSGTDTRRGSVNLSESLWSPTTARWVMDWPTHSGNGTFRSLNWGMFSDRYPYVQQFRYGRLYMARHPAMPTEDPNSTGYWVGAQNNMDLRPGTDEVWMSVYDNWFGHYYVGKQDLSVATTGAVQPLTPWLWNSASVENSRLLRWRPDGTLWMGEPGRGYIRQRDPATGASLGTQSLPALGVEVYGITAFAFSSNTEMWAVDGATTRIYRLTLSGSAWSVAQTLTIDSGISHHMIGLHSSGDIVVGYRNGDYVMKVSPSGETRWRGRGLSSGRNENHQIFHVPGTVDDYVSGYYPTNLQGPYSIAWRPGGLAVRALLPEAVTKGPVQTMKITYQFDFS